MLAAMGIGALLSFAATDTVFQPAPPETVYIVEQSAPPESISINPESGAMQLNENKTDPAGIIIGVAGIVGGAFLFAHGYNNRDSQILIDNDTGELTVKKESFNTEMLIGLGFIAFGGIALAIAF